MNRTVSLETVYSSHKKCFICGRKNLNTRLYKTPSNSIAYAYAHHKIIIKNDARCCGRHFNENGLIRENEFYLIPTKAVQFEKSFVKIIDSISDAAQTEKISQKIDVFESFKNVNTLTEEHCLKITKWSKEKFIEFCKLIKNIRNTDGRTKEELVALYRFWMKKGIDQTCLSMLKNDSTQQQISRYLSQIRIAINENFVPLFLGAKSRTREFFLEHNTPTCNELFNFDNQGLLCAIADGTYTRIEKSANNEFQYNSYSGQKLQHLLKPFLICCPDGYIIDCYVGFKANENDAAILEYILKTDKDLNEIFLKNKTVLILDRGFRDIISKLIKEYNFIPKIPHCKQIDKDGNKIEKKKKNNNKNKIEKKKKINNKKKNDLKENDVNLKEIKQLTTKEANETRLVTKVRFMVEKQMSALKNNFSLDYIRNTIAGHINIDYRIAAAMYNFDHTACYTDIPNTKQVAKTMRNINENHQINKLEFLINKRLGTNTFTKINLDDINDFVQLKRKRIKQKIFLGSFHLKISKSYLADLIGHNKCYLVNRDIVKSIPNDEHHKELLSDFQETNPKSKIIAVELMSRHSRGLITPKDEKKKTTQCKTNKKKMIKTKSKKKNKPKVTKKKDEIITGEKSEATGEIKKYRTIYKVFINYTPDLNETLQNENEMLNTKNKEKSIKSWICSCMNGRRTVGCCAHVATVIYYLSWAKYKDITIPAEHLNSIFIDKNKMEKANQPKYIKLKRKLKQDYSSSDSELDFDDEFTEQSNKKTCNKPINEGESIPNIENKENSEQNSVIDQPQQNTINDPSKENSVIEQPQQNTINDPSKENSVIDQPQENKINEPSKQNSVFEQPQQNTIDTVSSLTIDEFIAHIPKWGAYIDYHEKKNIWVKNTCSIDYLLFSLWVFNRIKPNIFASLPNNEETVILNDIIKNIDINNWNMARQLWIVQIMKYKGLPRLEKNINCKKELTICMFGSEDLCFISFINKYQLYDCIQLCNSNCINNGYTLLKNAKTLFFIKENGIVRLHSTYTGECPECQTQIMSDFRFINNTNFIFIEAAHNNIHLNDLPKQININNKIFRFLGTTLHKINHFIGIFEINGDLYIVDDIGQKYFYLQPMSLIDAEKRATKDDIKYCYSLPIGSAFYYLV